MVGNYAIKYLFIHSVNKFLLSTYYMPDPILGAGDIPVNNTDKNSCPQRDNIQVGERDNTKC